MVKWNSWSLGELAARALAGITIVNQWNAALILRVEPRSEKALLLVAKRRKWERSCSFGTGTHLINRNQAYALFKLA
jgi:hypothetical protein